MKNVPPGHVGLVMLSIYLVISSWVQSRLAAVYKVGKLYRPDSVHGLPGCLLHCWLWQCPASMQQLHVSPHSAWGLYGSDNKVQPMLQGD